jgi:hypothetical protein
MYESPRARSRCVSSISSSRTASTLRCGAAFFGAAFFGAAFFGAAFFAATSFAATSFGGATSAVVSTRTAVSPLGPSCRCDFFAAGVDSTRFVRSVAVSSVTSSPELSDSSASDGSSISSKSSNTHGFPSHSDNASSKTRRRSAASLLKNSVPIVMFACSAFDAFP